jgi:aminopeptidase N
MRSGLRISAGLFDMIQDPARQSLGCTAMRTLFLLAGLVTMPGPALTAQAESDFTHADTLRGTITPERAWWDVTYYDLNVRVSPRDSSIQGFNRISYRVLDWAREMQIDLMQPLEVDSMVQDGNRLSYRRDGDAFLVKPAGGQRAGDRKTIAVYYHGKPRPARKPPWDGGLIWTRDSLGHGWVASANQGLGASVWWPNKDTQAEEPDSQRIAITVPDSMIDVSNGRLRRTTRNRDGTTTYEWFVSNPINNYNVTINAGKYAHYSDTYTGEGGKLTLNFWPLAYHLAAAKKQFAQTRPMLKCFEKWFGPYPWYQDGYKLVESPHLGMEHQSAVAYGNHYQNGYLGKDLSNTGWGKRWDFIVVHESAHEWFGNNITVKDIADNWVHEGFANYAENLFAECQDGPRAGSEYVIGTRPLIKNDMPVVGHYGVNRSGSSDMYSKGGNMLHTIRQVIGDDAKWRRVLRGLNQEFRHQTVTGKQVQDYMSRESGIDLSRIFAQYLLTIQIPVLEYKIDASQLSYRWANVIPGFDMPVRVTLSDSGYTTIRPTESWQTATLTVSSAGGFRVDRNFYIETRDVSSSPPPLQATTSDTAQPGGAP